MQFIIHVCTEHSLCARQFQMPRIYLCVYKLTCSPGNRDSIKNVNKKIVYSMLESDKCSEKKLN